VRIRRHRRKSDGDSAKDACAVSRFYVWISTILVLYKYYRHRRKSCGDLAGDVCACEPKLLRSFLIVFESYSPTMMQDTEVHTAICYASQSHDLEEPLIDISLETDGDCEETLAYTQEHLSRIFQFVGWALGFLLQCISLGGTAVIAFHWDKDSSPEYLWDKTLYATMYGLSNCWLLLLPIGCIAIKRSWARRGVEYIQAHFTSSKNQTAAQKTHRTIFLVGVQFLVGIVLGCFSAWGLVGIYFGASCFMFMTLFVSMMACLALSYGMVVIYDIHSDGEQDI
jgi:hypothetical protein